MEDQAPYGKQIPEQLIGRWQSYKFIIKGESTESKSLLIQIHADGKVDEAYFFNGWHTDGVKRWVELKEGQAIIQEEGGNPLIISEVGKREMKLKIYSGALEYQMKRVENPKMG